MEALLERKSQSRGWAAVGVIALLGLLLATAFAPSAQARVEGFQELAPSPVELTAVAADPNSSLIYAQEDGGTKFFVYDPRTNVWAELAPSPLDSGNNGGAAYLGGKIYVVYTGNATELAVYDIASNTWTTIDNPLASGTGNIASGGGKLYLAVEDEFISLDPATGIATPLAEPPKFPLAEGTEGFEKWGGLQVVDGKIYGHQGNGNTGFGVYDIASNSWLELPYAPKVPDAEGGEPEGPLLGSAFNPLTNTYITYGPYSGKSLFRYDIEANAWSNSPLPFVVDDGGMAYITLPGFEGIYMVQGEEGPAFARYTERNSTDLSPTVTAKVAKGGKFTYTVLVKNNGPERAGGVVLTNSLPAKTTLLSATASQGACAGTSVLSCNLGLLRSGASATLTIQVKAKFKKVTSTATVTSQAVDSNAANDSATLVTKQCVVPKLKKRSVKRAKKALRKANCKPGKVKHRFNGKVKEDKVIRGGKKRGKLLPAGSKVKLIVSDGPKGAN
ncbi:MAG TPA: PASTA domain-containing protein [Solirubrobacterales bacterium]|nr:PASTA domain-containing protein [Solirubrobacterales bacterium]